MKPEHVRTQPHQILFKAKDDFLGDGLSVVRIVRFHASAVSGAHEADPEIPGLEIFPNPNSGMFNVELPEATTAGMSLRILGLDGQLLQEQPVQMGSEMQTVRMGNFPPGLYFLQLWSAGELLGVEKFVHQ